MGDYFFLLFEYFLNYLIYLDYFVENGLWQFFKIKVIFIIFIRNFQYLIYERKWLNIF